MNRFLCVNRIIIIAFFMVSFCFTMTLSMACQQRKPADSPIKPETKSIVQSNFDRVQIALERYASRNFKYPEDITELQETGLLPSETDPTYPRNPYTANPVRFIDFKTKPFAGEITYIPVKEGERVKGYYLLGYGDRSNRGLDVDGDGKPDNVIIVMQGPNYQLIADGLSQDLADKMRRYLADDDLTPLEDILSSR